MTFVAFHPALRINTNPLAPDLGVIATINLALDHPDNYGNDGKFETVRMLHSMVSDYQVTEQVGNATTRRRALKGLGVRLRFELEFTTYPRLGNTANGVTLDGDLQELMNSLAVGASGFNDGISRYLWITPNYQWNEPAEQWLRVLPDGTPSVSFPPKTYATVYKISLLQFQNFKRITWGYWHRGGFKTTPGTAASSTVSLIVAGTGPTRFKRDFINGDRVRINSGGNPGTVIGIVSSVQSDSSMTLAALAAVNYSGAVIAEQKSMPTWLVPVYNQTEFAPSAGWGISPWGDNWSR